MAATIYIDAATCLIIGNRAWLIAVIACAIELLGVLAIGSASYVRPDLFPDRTVWSHFGQGYGFLPAVLPVLGLWWLIRTRLTAGISRARSAACPL